MPTSESQRVRFNPISLINPIVSSFTQVPTSEPHLCRDEEEIIGESVDDHEQIAHSQPFPKRQRTRHKSEASPRRATCDSAMAQPESRDHASETSEKRIVRHTRKRRISGLSYQNADLCGQIQVMCGVISFIVEIMLLIQFKLPHHLLGLGFVAGIIYLLAGGLGLQSAHSKRYRTIVLCVVMSTLSMIIALYVAGSSLDAVLKLTEPPPPPLPALPVEEDLDYADDYTDHDYAELDDGAHAGPSPELVDEHPNQLVYKVLYSVMILVSSIDVIFALAQVVIWCSVTCCPDSCVRRKVTAQTIIYRNYGKLVDGEVTDDGPSDECHIDEIWVIPGVQTDDNATADNYRAMEEYEVDNKGKKKKKKISVI